MHPEFRCGFMSTSINVSAAGNRGCLTNKVTRGSYLGKSCTEGIAMAVATDAVELSLTSATFLLLTRWNCSAVDPEQTTWRTNSFILKHDWTNSGRRGSLLWAVSRLMAGWDFCVQRLHPVGLRISVAVPFMPSLCGLPGACVWLLHEIGCATK